MKNKKKTAVILSGGRHSGRSRRINKNIPVGMLLQENPKLLHVLHKHGIHFCPGCYLTLFASPRKAAAYHAVPDVEKFLKELEKAIK